MSWPATMAPRPSSADPVVHATADLAELVLAQKAGQPWDRSVRPRPRCWIATSQRKAAATRLPSVVELAPRRRISGMVISKSAPISSNTPSAEFQHPVAVALQAEALGTVALVESYWTRIPSASAAASQAEELLASDALRLPSPFSWRRPCDCLISADHAGLDRCSREPCSGTWWERNLVWSQPYPGPGPC